MASGDKAVLVLRIRGLPWAATEDDVKGFFESAGPGIQSVHFTYNREGRPSGEAYLAFCDINCYNEAMKKDRARMGHRYIEVFTSQPDEMEKAVAARGQPTMDERHCDGTVRLRGLPFGCTSQQIARFFDGLGITEQDVYVMPTDEEGRRAGEAFVQFPDQETTKEALTKHLQHMGKRYIEVFRSSQAEMESLVSRRLAGGGGASRARPYDRSALFGGVLDDYPRDMVGLATESYMMGGGGGMAGGRPGSGAYGAPPSSIGGWGYGGGRAAMVGNGAGGPIRSSLRGRGRGASMMGMGGMGGGGMMGMGSGGMMGMGSMGMGMGGMSMDAGYGGMGGYDGIAGMGHQRHFVKMRGVPFNATERDLMQFFYPLKVFRAELIREFKSDKPTGEARVEFASHDDALMAMEKDRELMGTRYVELFLQSNP